MPGYWEKYPYRVVQPVPNRKVTDLMYNAEAFQVMMGSSAEDLLAKMPGIVVEGGTIQAQENKYRKSWWTERNSLMVM